MSVFPRQLVYLLAAVTLVMGCAAAPREMPAPVRPDPAAFEQAVTRLGADLAERLEMANVVAVACARFRPINLNPWSSVFQELFFDQLYFELIASSDGRFQIVERDQLDRVLAELGLSADIAFDPTTRAKLKKLVGANAIIVGSLQEIGSQIKVNARVVNLETGTVINAATKSFPIAVAPSYPQ